MLLDARAGAPVVPASTAKIATAVAVLTALPAQERLVTRAVAGPQPGDVVLVGGGDVTLAGPAAPAPGPTPSADDSTETDDAGAAPVLDEGPARLADLATQVLAALGATAPARVLVDDTAYQGPCHRALLAPVLRDRG